MQGAVQVRYAAADAAVAGAVGAPIVPIDAVLLHLRSTRLAAVPVRSMNAICEPSSEIVGESSTKALAPVVYDQYVAGMGCAPVPPHDL